MSGAVIRPLPRPKPPRPRAKARFDTPYRPKLHIPTLIDAWTREEESKRALLRAFRKLEKKQEARRRVSPPMRDRSGSYTDIHAALPCGHGGPAIRRCGNTMASHHCSNEWNRCDVFFQCANCGRWWND